MKYLIIFLFSFNLYASWTATITRDGKQTNRGEKFKTEKMAKKWVKENSKHFGFHTVDYVDNSVKEMASINSEISDKNDRDQVRSILKDIKDPVAKRAIIKLFKKVYGSK